MNGPDRIVVHDLRPFNRIQRGQDDLSVFSSLLGFPVYVDAKVEVGVIELRRGDKTVERVLVSELRA